MPVSRSIRHSSRPIPKASFRVRQQSLFLADALPMVRWLAVATLVVSLVVGAARWVVHPPSVGALEFTPHIVGQATSAVGVRGTSVADLDNDGWRDVVTAGLSGVKVYRNKGNYSFEGSMVTDRDAERVQIIDLNADGKLDLLVEFNGSSPSIRWFENKGGFEFENHTLGSTGSDAVAYAGDIDADGSPDIITAGTEGGVVVLRRWMNNGSGSFSSTTVSADSGVSAVTIGDLNHNGYNDIVTGGTKGLQRWDTSDGANWVRVDVDDRNANRTHLAMGDPKDGGTWIISGDDSTNELVLYRSGQGDNHALYGRLEIDTGVDVKTVVPADLNGDGSLDIIVAAQDDNAIYWYQNDGSDAFTKRTIASGLRSVFGVGVGDLDKDSDLDVVAGDSVVGTIYAYERLRVKPKATAPSEIAQSTAGTGRVMFKTKISDGDGDPSKIRVEYSTNGANWYKPWIVAVSADHGKVDLKNENRYQIGTSDSIDTDKYDNVTLTITWDTKSVNNTGGPIVGSSDTVRLRIIPVDSKEVGVAATSQQFQVDNQAPTKVSNFRATSTADTELMLSWDRAMDESDFTYQIYFGTDQESVVNRRSEVWDSADDEKMNDMDSTGTKVTGLEPGRRYIFKLFVTDAYGNVATTASLQATTQSASGDTTLDPTPSGTPTYSPIATVSPIKPSQIVVPTNEPYASVSAAPTASPALGDNNPPIADAGPDQVVNPSALVILDGTSSYDSDPGETSALSFSWRQVSGPHVKLIADRTATASFAAGDENETYIFSLSVHDLNGSSAMDTVTVATKSLPPAGQEPARITTSTSSQTPTDEQQPPFVSNVLEPLDILLLILSMISTGILLAERTNRVVREGKSKTIGARGVVGARSQPQGRVVHHRTGTPIAGAQVLIYGQDGKLRATERTNEQGSFPTFFPAGQYTLDVRAEGFASSSAASKTIASADSILYTGGQLTVKNAYQPLSIVVPMKPSTREVGSLRIYLLHVWQSTQRMGRVLSWPIFLTGALLNTVLIFLAPSFFYLAVEVVYIVLVVVKIALEVRMRPAYGQVRNAITHVPLDLAVVRLFEQGTNRLVMTRVTNSQGKFFALPPAGSYTVTVSKPGYANFTKENVELKPEEDTTMQMIADLMPVAPSAGGLRPAHMAA